MPGPGAARVALRKKQADDLLDGMMAQIKEKGLGVSQETQALFTINAILVCMMHLIGDLIDEVSSTTYSTESREDG